MGYPQDNIIFQQADRAMLSQDGKWVMGSDLTQPQAFEGICLVDTFEDQRIEQLGFLTPENMKRVERQRQSEATIRSDNQILMW